MNIQVSPIALKTASALVECELYKGNRIQDSKVRDNGNLLEWLLDDGGLIECVRRRDYSTGRAVVIDTIVRRYEETEDKTFKVVFEKSFK